jgi:hypothetical protein
MLGTRRHGVDFIRQNMHPKPSTFPFRALFGTVEVYHPHQLAVSGRHPNRRVTPQQPTSMLSIAPTRRTNSRPSAVPRAGDIRLPHRSALSLHGSGHAAPSSCMGPAPSSCRDMPRVAAMTTAENRGTVPSSCLSSFLPTYCCF